MRFQQLILELAEFWTSRSCVLQHPLDIEVGVGAMHPETSLLALWPALRSVAWGVGWHVLIDGLGISTTKMTTELSPGCWRCEES